MFEALGMEKGGTEAVSSSFLVLPLPIIFTCLKILIQLDIAVKGLKPDNFNFKNQLQP